MIRSCLPVLFVCLFSVQLFAQPDETLITIGDRKISKGEFERIYKKNNNNLYNPADKKSPEEYVGMFVDFKLKVIEAENLKMDTSAAFKKELAGYRSELAAPYLTDVKLTKEMVAELYDRTTKEVNASHILLNVPENATRQQENETKERILKIKAEILAGKDFEEAAYEYSEDPSAKTNKGNLGYFSAFMMVVPFENAAFSTPKGQVSEPVRTSFGWHILKVNDIRPNQGELLVAHIMKMFPKDMTPEVKADLKKQIDSIYTEVKNGADFAETARTKSDDKRSAQSGGQMPWFSAGRMIPEFAKPAFALKNNGDISEVIESPYGYHIIKRIDHKPVASFDEAKEEIEFRIRQDPQRSESSKANFIAKLKKEYNFTENTANLDQMLDKTLNDSLIDLKMDLFTLNGVSFDAVKFKNYISKQHTGQGEYRNFYDQWVDFEITDYENSRLEEKYPDFKYMMQEYHDGMLLFNISEQKIWNFASEDSTGLEAFYKTCKKYLWEERFKGMIVNCTSDSVREEAEKYFAADIPMNEVLSLLNKNGEVIVITEGAWEKGASKVVDYYVWNGPEPEDFDSGLTFIRGDKVPPEPKKLDEARGLYISDYQKAIEERWLKELHSKYKVTINKKLLKTIPGV